jgi:hypothetical protein
VAVALGLNPLETWVLCRVALMRGRHTPVVGLSVTALEANGDAV